MNKTRVSAYIKLILAPIIWGGALSAARVVTTIVPPFTTSCIRFILAALIMVPALYIIEGKFPRITKKEFFLLTLLSLTGMVMFNVFLFSALKTITAIRSSIMIAFTPVVVALAAFVLFKELINKVMAVGIFISIVGVLITVTSGNISGVIANGLSIGDIYMTLAVLSWAFYSIVIKSAIARLSALAALSYGALIGIVMLLPFTFIERGWSTLSNLTLTSTISLLYLGFFSAGIAYLWYFEGIKEVGASKSSVFLNLEPVAAILIGVVFLKEVLTLPLFIGAILVMGGLFLTSYTHPSKKERLS